MPTVGVVYDVSRDLLYAGAAGRGATCNGAPIAVPDEPLSSASVLMMTSNLIDRDGRCPAWASRFLMQTDLKVRVLGTAAIEAIMVGSGVAHGAITVNGKLWDAVAAAGVVLAAGGTMSHLTGGSLFPYDITDYRGAKVPFLAAAPQAEAALLAELAKV